MPLVHAVALGDLGLGEREVHADLANGIVVLQAPTDLLPQPDVIHNLKVGRGLRILEDVGHL